MASSTSETGPFDLATTPIHLPGATSSAVPLPGFGFDGPSFEAYIEEHCSDADPGRLVMIETTAESWPTWECHPVGAELVIVLAGRGTFHQEIDGEVRSTPFEAGTTLINPPGVWHTADVSEAMRAIYITPCPGTDHRPR